MNGFAIFPLIIFGFIGFMILGMVLIFSRRDKSKDIKNKKQAQKGLVGLLSGEKKPLQNGDEPVKHEHVVQRTRRGW